MFLWVLYGIGLVNTWSILCHRGHRSSQVSGLSAPQAIRFIKNVVYGHPNGHRGSHVAYRCHRGHEDSRHVVY